MLASLLLCPRAPLAQGTRDEKQIPRVLADSPHDVRPPVSPEGQVNAYGMTLASELKLPFRPNAVQELELVLAGQPAVRAGERHDLPREGIVVGCEGGVETCLLGLGPQHRRRERHEALSDLASSLVVVLGTERECPLHEPNARGRLDERGEIVCGSPKSRLKGHTDGKSTRAEVVEEVESPIEQRQVLHVEHQAALSRRSRAHGLGDTGRIRSAEVFARKISNRTWIHGDMSVEPSAVQQSRDVTRGLHCLLCDCRVVDVLTEVEERRRNSTLVP